MREHINEAREYLRLNSIEPDIQKFISCALSGKPVHPKNALLMAVYLAKLMSESQEARSMANSPKTKGSKLDTHDIHTDTEAFHVVYLWKTGEIGITEASERLADMLNVSESAGKRYLKEIADRFTFLWEALGCL